MEFVLSIPPRLDKRCRRVNSQSFRDASCAPQALPQCSLGFLNAIPPIGSKFKGASTCGPQSQPNIANGEYSGSVVFYFGKLP
jgi:hypothetical protein